MKKIIDELNTKNGSNYKLDVLKKYQAEGKDELIKRVLMMTYDKVKFTYGVTMKNIDTWRRQKTTLSLNDALDILEKEFVTRQVTGNAALQRIEDILGKLSNDDAFVFAKILDRDLKINLGRSQINKVYKNLIVKPPYMRCGIWNPKTAKKISWLAFLQQKADGTYRSIIVDSGQVTFQSRSGEISEFPILEEHFKKFPSGVYIGELLMRGESNRAISNGRINSSEPPHSKIYVQLWDYVTLGEYSRPKDKTDKTYYTDRFKTLKRIVKTKYTGGTSPVVEIIPSHMVSSPKQAMEIVSTWMKNGYEGGVIKDPKNIFVDHTSPTQLKIKLVMDAEVRIVGFEEGKKGSKREKTFGAIIFETDDKKVQGRTSGFTDKELLDFNSRREELIGTIMTVEFNDITRGRSSDTYALSHPRHIEMRPDRDSTDTLERIQSSKKMAMCLTETTKN